MIQLTDEQIEKARQLILNPPPNSKIAEAKEFGIDMTLLLRRLKLTPEQRLDELQHRKNEGLAYFTGTRRIKRFDF